MKIPRLKIPFVDLKKDYERNRSAIIRAVKRVLASGEYILGPEVTRLERRLGEVLKTNVVTVGNGSDALVLALRMAGVKPGDEVITAANSFIASAWSIKSLGATPVFVDIDETLNIDPKLLEIAINSKTAAIMPVHLYGNPANIKAIREATKGRIPIIEDAAQAFGASIDGNPIGSDSQYACFSLHPLKNLGILGDGGFVTTPTIEKASELKLIRNHGLLNRNEVELWGVNSRLDEIQAAIANIRLDCFAKDQLHRQKIAKFYDDHLSENFCIPERIEGSQHSWHRYVVLVKNRDSLIRYARTKGIDLAIHYPIPIHLQKIGKDCIQSTPLLKTEDASMKIVSLPLNPMTSMKSAKKIVSTLNSFKLF